MIKKSEISAPPLFRKVDCYSLPVSDLDSGIEFYSKLGHRIIWKDGNYAAGLRLPDSDSEIVLHTDNRPVETDILVESVPEAIDRFVEAGGKLIAGPFEIKIGLFAKLADPWGNPFCILDFSKGLLATDADGNVTGNLDPVKQN